MKLKILSAPLFLLIGALFSLAIYAVQATISSVNSGEPLTASKWNEVVNKINELEGRMDSSEGNCSNPSLLFDSTKLSKNPMDSGKYQEGIIPVPLECIDSTCLLKQEIYGQASKTLKSVKIFSYFQDSAYYFFDSDFSTSGNLKNGDTTSSNFQKSYNGLYLRDDYNGTAPSKEITSANWTFIDRDSAYDMKVYICASVTSI